MYRLISLWITFVLVSTTSSAQYYEFGIGLGSTLYNGDLNAPHLSTNLSNAEFGGQLILRYIAKKNVVIRANLTLGKLSGDDRKSELEFQKIRNLRFTSLVVEGALLGEYYIFGYDAKASSQLFSPYFTVGFGFFYFNPKSDLNGETYDLQPLGTEGQGLPGQESKYSKMALAIPFGGGVKIKINDKYNFGIELLARRSFTDYIDDVSTVYANTEDLFANYGAISAAFADRRGEALGVPQLNTPGSIRGGSSEDDYYFSFMFNLTANLESMFGLGQGSRGIDCPRF